MGFKINRLVLIVLVIIIALVIAGGIYWRQKDVSGPISADIGEGSNIFIADFAFQPQELIIKEGATVIWRNDDSVVHSVVSNEGMFKSPTLNKGDEFSFTFSKAGVHDYHCGIHPSMRGKIIVK